MLTDKKTVLFLLTFLMAEAGVLGCSDSRKFKGIISPYLWLVHVKRNDPVFVNGKVFVCLLQNIWLLINIILSLSCIFFSLPFWNPEVYYLIQNILPCQVASVWISLFSRFIYFRGEGAQVGRGAEEKWEHLMQTPTEHAAESGGPTTLRSPPDLKPKAGRPNNWATQEPLDQGILFCFVCF